MSVHTPNDPREPTVARERMRLNIPVSNDGMTVTSIHMSLPRVMDEAEWRQFHKVLRRMKPALVIPTENRES